jgi:hypothetical protein
MTSDASTSWKPEVGKRSSLQSCHTALTTLHYFNSTNLLQLQDAIPATTLEQHQHNYTTSATPATPLHSHAFLVIERDHITFLRFVSLFDVVSQTVLRALCASDQMINSRHYETLRAIDLLPNCRLMANVPSATDSRCPRGSGAVVLRGRAKILGMR